jgi:hypothetical protein
MDASWQAVRGRESRRRLGALCLTLAITIIAAACSPDDQGAQLSLSMDPVGGPVRVDPLWTVATGSLVKPRLQHTATLLGNGKVLIAGGSVTGADLDELSDVELYDPATGTSTPTTPLSTARRRHIAVRLPDGRVLIVGGESNGNATTSTELFDPSTNGWSDGPPMLTARTFFTGSLMSDGKVLVVGGNPGMQPCEIFDPDAGSWAPTGSLNDPREAMPIVPLGRDAYLVASSIFDGGGSSEIYDRSTGVWSFTPSFPPDANVGVRSMTQLADGRVATTLSTNQIDLYSPESQTWAVNPSPWTGSSDLSLLLRDGRLLAFDAPSPSPNGVEAFDPASGSVTDAGTLSFFHNSGVAVVMPSGRINVFGGTDSMGATPQIEINDDATPCWGSAGTMRNPRAESAVVALPDGSALVAGGRSGPGLRTVLATAERYFSDTGLWSPAATMGVPRRASTATLLPDGKVLVAGGWLSDGTASTAAELYDPATNRWSTLESMSLGHAGHAAVLLASGKVLVVGGGAGAAQRAAEELDPGSGVWTRLPDMTQLRARPAAVLLGGGRALVVGGGAGPTEEYAEDSRTWTTVGELSAARDGAAAAVLPGGKVLVTGGTVSGTPVQTTELYDPVSRTFVAAPPMTAARAGHAQAVLLSGLVIAAGGDGSGTAEQYDPETSTWRATVPLSAGRSASAAALLLDGTWLVVGGDVSGAPSSSAEKFDEGRQGLSQLTPSVTAAPAAAELGSAVSISGSGLFPLDSSSGGREASPSNFPLVSFARWQGGPTASGRVTHFSDAQADVVVPASLPAGWYALRVVVNGVQAAPRTVRLTRPGEDDSDLMWRVSCGCGASPGDVWVLMLGLAALVRTRARKVSPPSSE